jgi:hypothetical protein
MGEIKSGRVGGADKGLDGISRPPGLSSLERCPAQSIAYGLGP